jgi:cytochrome P450
VTPTDHAGSVDTASGTQTAHVQRWYIPTGTIIGIPTTPHHTDSGIYTNANVLDPSRFERTEGAESKKYFTSIDSDASYLSFGIGKSTHVYILPSEYADRA